MRTLAAGTSLSGAFDNRKRKLEPVPEHRRAFKRRERRDSDEARRWVYSSRDFSALKDRFRIVSYNILGVGNAANHLDLYNQVDPRYLNWERRKKRICKELSRYNAGILCLQEVDRFNDLEDLLQEDGYVGVYKRRTGGATDGCAVFWKEEQLSLIYQESIEFRKFGLRDNVAQLCLLKVGDNCSKASTSEDSDCEIAEPMMQRTLLVANIHVLFNPNRGDIKLGQIRVLFERVHAILQERRDCPVVICGDLNSLPQSAVYQFLSSSQLNILSYERKKISGQIVYPSNQIPFAQIDGLRYLPVAKPKRMTYFWSQEEILLAAGTTKYTNLQIPLKLSSAYKGVPGNPKTRDQDGEPLVTSFHSKFLGTVDYIWHSAALAPVGVVETLPVSVLKRLRGLPSSKWGSDHLSLVSKMLAIFNSSITNPPVELVDAGARSSTPKKPALDLLHSFLTTFPSSVSARIDSLAYISYTHQNESSLHPRKFALKDEIFCLFEGSLNNLSRLNQHYGLARVHENVLVMEAYRALRDRAPYPTSIMLRHLAGRFAFIVFDKTTSTVFAAADRDGGVPFFLGVTADGYLAFSDDSEILRGACGKSLAPFPSGCYFSSSTGLKSFEDPLDKVIAVPAMEEDVWGATFKIEKTNAETTSE
ncbi:hypothetical protein J5N97_007527 [Dioscorea zingiberensis]|uniref:DUF3700 domain-containing protein n=1 Tax=Dioscorea zingiberensis TaxID=325984 RepID=A0A9D5DC57_9LILI|nr:hypothetical protein J5N97_007527 [Dioscorea zingiberensis]